MLQDRCKETLKVHLQNKGLQNGESFLEIKQPGFPTSITTGGLLINDKEAPTLLPVQLSAVPRPVSPTYPPTPPHFP